MKKSILIFSQITLCILLLSACGGHSASGSDDINPRDTVTVPEGYTGEDSIAYIENVVLKDHITVSDFLELAEVHELEDRLFLYNDSISTPRDKAAMRLANRFMRMHYVAISGDASSKLQWAMAVRQEWYSMKPMEIEGYRKNLSSNRRVELEVEREIILSGKPYQQKGKTVTAKEWEQWIADNSVPDDIDDLKKMGDTDRIPSDSLVADRVNTLKSTFSRWLKARQALAAALPKEQGDSYDFLTADIHSRMVGKLADIIPYENW